MECAGNSQVALEMKIMYILSEYQGQVVLVKFKFTFCIIRCAIRAISSYLQSLATSDALKMIISSFNLFLKLTAAPCLFNPRRRKICWGFPLSRNMQAKILLRKINNIGERVRKLHAVLFC